MAFNEFVSYILDNQVDPDDKVVESVFDIISVFSSFNELLNGLNSKPRYYADIIDYCVTKVNYNVFLELESGEKVKLNDIKKALSW